MAFTQKPNQLILAAIRVLILIYHQVADSLVVCLPNLRTMLEQADRFQQQIVEIESIAFPQSILISLEHNSKSSHFRIGGILIEILRRFFLVFRLADSGKRSAVLHEFLIQSEAAEGLFDDGELVIIIVDV